MSATPSTPSKPSRSSTRKRAAALGALWLVVMGGMSWVSGCYGRNCEGETKTYGRNPGEGRMIDPNTWESNPIDGKWLPFPQQRVWIFEMKDLGQRVPFAPIAYVSAEEDPLRDNSNFTVAAGNLAEISGIGEGRFVVKNGTCADYYVRVVAQASPLPSPTPTPTATATADAAADTGAPPPKDAGADGDAEAGP